MSMPGKKLSGAQNRKRKLKQEKEMNKSRMRMDSYLVKKSLEEKPEDTKDEEVKSEAQSDSSCTHTANTAQQIQDFQDDEYGGPSTSEVPKPCPHSTENAEKSLTVIPDVLEFKDVAYLKFGNNLPIISNQLRTEMIIRGPHVFQNECSLNAPSTSVERLMPKSWFYRQVGNDEEGTEIKRSWLLYSPKNNAAYCFCCLLFTTSESATQSSFVNASGFKKWSKKNKLIGHERSPNHRKSFTVWKETERRLTTKTAIDASLETMIQSEKERWRNILQRVLSCMKYLIMQDLPLRGHVENLALKDGTNVGNLLSLLKLVAQFDPLLASHLKNVTETPRTVSYLSPQIQNEFIHLLASTVRDQLISDIKRNKYYGLLFDTTPDVAHREQMSQVFRYVDVDFTNRKVSIKESFLGFIEIHAKDAASIENTILDKLNSDQISIRDCRSQCYDNAAVMSGHISGVQQRIVEKNDKALFVNCDNHSLNLVGVTAAKQDPIVVTCFGVIENIYLFFSRSTLRWEQLKNALKKTVKRESETRWSDRTQAVAAIVDQLEELVELLEKIAEDTTVTSDTRSEATVLLQNILNFNFITLVHFWHEILRRIDRVQLRLQDPKMNFREAFKDLDSLSTELAEIRDEICEEALEKAKSLCEKWGIDVTIRVRRRRKMPGELASDVGLSAESEVSRVMKSVVDRLQQEISTRFTRLRDLNSKFGFLLDVEALLKKTYEDKDLEINCKNLGEFYNTDFNGTELYVEICDCRMLLRSRNGVEPKTPLELLTFIISYGEDVFPNLRVALQILLTISVSIASCERSFSKLKLIFTYLRSSMGQERLSDLAFLSVEREKFEMVNFDEVIDIFASSKARKIYT